MKVKIFAVSEVDLVHKVGAYAYTFYDYRDQFTRAKSFKTGIKTMVHADCMAFVNALSVLSKMVNGQNCEVLEVVTDSRNVADLLIHGKAQKHCEEAAKYWTEVVKPMFPLLQHINIIKIDRHGTGPADNIIILKRLKELASVQLGLLKELAN